MPRSISWPEDGVAVAPYTPTFGAPSGVGDANAEGTSSNLVRQDHVHQRDRTDSRTIVVAASNSIDPTLADLAYRVDGVADETEINNGLTVIGADGCLILLEGDYNLAATINFAGHQEMLMGNGKGTRLLPAEDVDAITLNGYDGCIVCDLWIDGTDSGTGRGIYFNNSDYSIIMRVWIQDTGSYCIFIDDNVYYLLFFGNFLSSQATNSSIYFSSDGDNNYAVISNNHITIDVTGPNGINIASGGGDRGIIIGNYIQSGNFQIIMYDSLWVICGNELYNATYTGISIQAGAVVTNVCGNQIYYAGWYGIEITAAADYLVISSNTVRRCARHGITSGGDHCTIIGNNCQENDRDDTATYDGIIVSGDYNVIVGNRCYNNDRYEINIAGGATRNKVFHNALYGTDHVAPFNDAGTDTELPTKIFQFQAGGDEATGIIITQFIHGTASAKGWEVDANTEWASALGQMPSEVMWVVRTRVWGVGLAGPGAGNAMRLEININAGSEDEAFNTHTINVPNHPSDVTNFAANDVVKWTVVGPTVLVAGDSVEVKVLHEAAGNGDIATDAVFRSVEVQYV